MLNMHINEFQLVKRNFKFLYCSKYYPFALEAFFEEATQQLEIVLKIFCDPHIQRPNFSGVKKNFSCPEILPKRAWL